MFPFLVSCVGQGKVDDQLLQGTKNFLSHLDKELKGKQTLCGVSHEKQKKWIKLKGQSQQKSSAFVIC